MSNLAPGNKKSASFPNTFFGMVCCLCICATLAFIAYLVVGSTAKPTPRLWLPIRIETDGRETVMGETRQIEFWTPSAETKTYLQLENGQVADNEQWQVIPDDEVVVQFGTMLHSNDSVLGYRRVPVWGRGRTNYKPGWWWTITVTTNFTAADLAKSYQSFWKSKQGLFVEVIDNRGNDLQ